MPQLAEGVVSVPIQNIMNVVNTHLQWKQLNGPPRSNLVYHPSSFGKCLRKEQYKLFEEKGWIEGDKEKKTNEVLRIFDTGHTMHHRWAKYFEDIGVLRGRWHCSNPTCYLWNDNGNFDVEKLQTSGMDVDNILKTLHTRKYGYDELIGCFKPKKCVCGSTHFNYHEVAVVAKELNFEGHADMILDFSNFKSDMYQEGKKVKILFNLEDLPQKPVVIDMKTINTQDFQNKVQQKMHFEYKVQLTIYINILGLEQGVLIYENKDNCRVRVFEVHKNPKMWDKIKSQASLMKQMIDYKRLPPPRPTTKTDRECRYCSFRSKCHGEDGSKSIWDHPNLDKLREEFYGNFD